MLIEDITKLKDKLEKQVANNEPYSDIYETSVKIDKLLVEYYQKYGLSKED